MTTAKDLVVKLQEKARPDQLEGLAKFKIGVEKRLGVPIPELRKIAKQTAKNHRLALALWKTGIPDAMILASMVDRPEAVTEKQMDSWVADFNSWDVCDQVCMNLFGKSPHAWRKIHDWAKREEEYTKRAAFTLIACLALHDKAASDDAFIGLIPLIRGGASDDRNFVKKAVNWALRNIGKRNPTLNQRALKTAKEMQKMDSKAARWIGSDAVRDLTSDATKRRLSRIKI